MSIDFDGNATRVDEFVTAVGLGASTAGGGVTGAIGVAAGLVR